MADDSVAFPTLGDTELAHLDVAGTRRPMVAGEYRYNAGDAGVVPVTSRMPTTLNERPAAPVGLMGRSIVSPIFLLSSYAIFEPSTTSLLESASMACPCVIRLEAAPRCFGRVACYDQVSAINLVGRRLARPGVEAICGKAALTPDICLISLIFVSGSVA